MFFCFLAEKNVKILNVSSICPPYLWLLKVKSPDTQYANNTELIFCLGRIIGLSLFWEENNLFPPNLLPSPLFFISLIL